jgi:hypothetical protein
VFVGIRRETLTVEQIWLRMDGGLAARGFVHYPLPGRTVAGEVMTVFGLTEFRRFSPSEFAGIRNYTHTLERDLRGDAPHVLSPGPIHHAFCRNQVLSSDRNAK